MSAGTEIRQKRQEAIKDILRKHSIARQSQLVAMLQDQGIDATQSSVSRDLKQLGISKLDEGYADLQAAQETDNRDLVLMGEFFRSIDTAGSNLTIFFFVLLQTGKWLDADGNPLSLWFFI